MEVLEYEILPRLPLSELLRLRCVCKRWKDLIRDLAFVQRHQAFHPPAPSTPILIIHDDFALDPRKPNPSWVRANPLPCPTDPRGLLVASSGGLVCHAINTFDEKENITQTDFVISNPITGKYRKLPTLIHSKLGYSTVTMVVRDGVFHQLWVGSFGTCIYDCFATKETMEKRIHNLRNERIFSLPNGWFSVHILGFLCFFDDKIICCWRMMEVVDINDFSMVYEGEEAEERAWTVGHPWVLLGKLVRIVETPSLEYRVCAISIDYQAGKTSVETLFRFKLNDRQRECRFIAAGDVIYVDFFKEDGLLFRLTKEEMNPEGFLRGQQISGRFVNELDPIVLDSISLADPLAGSTGMSSSDWESLQLPPCVDSDDSDDEFDDF